MTDLLFPEEAMPRPVPRQAAEAGPAASRDVSPGRESAPPAQGLRPAASYRVLARAYRPQRFDDLIGQEAMIRTLTNAFARKRIAHAYMLTGVRGVGKTTTARILARALNCTGPDGTGEATIRPCGVCDTCRAIADDRHPDVIELDAASNTGVDNARELMEQARLRPMSARARVFIIDEVHMLSNAAFNALLKTLEEPPPHVTFILATTELRKVPVTVLSRCQTFQLRRVPLARLAEHFATVAEREGVQAEPEAILAIARAADGSVRDGLSLLDQAIAMADGRIEAQAVRAMLGQADRSLVLRLFAELMRGRIEAALELFEGLHEVGAAPNLVIEDLLEHAHFLSRLKVAPGLAADPALPETERGEGAELAQSLSVATLARAWQMLLKGLAEVQTAPDPRAAAEMVLIRIAFAADLPSPAELVREAGQARGGSAPSPRPGAPSGSSGARAVQAAQAQPVAVAAEAPLPRVDSFRAVVALAAERREALLAGHLQHSVRLVRFAPPVIELRPEADAPRDLAPRLAKFLHETTGSRWTVAFSQGQGDATLAEADRAAEAQTLERVSRHPLVLAVLEAFPGARIEAVRQQAPGEERGIVSTSGDSDAGMALEAGADDTDLPDDADPKDEDP